MGKARATGIPQRLRRLKTRATCGAIAALALLTVSPGTALSQETPTRTQKVSATVAPPVSGRVVDTEGNPVEGARVALCHLTASAQTAPGAGVVEETVSDAQGAFRLAKPARFLPTDSFARGKDFFVLLAVHSDYAVGWAKVERGQVKDAYTLTLTEPRPITITVTDLEGKPLEGARVWPYSLGGRNARHPAHREYVYILPEISLLSATTDAEGKATLKNQPEARSSLHAALPGYAMGLAFPGGKKIRLAKGATLEGMVKTTDGKPVQGAIVELSADWMSLRFLAQTNEEGIYRLEDVAAKGWDMSPWGKKDQPGTGKFRLKCFDALHATRPETIQLDPGAKVTKDFTLERACVLAGRVIDVTTNRPVAGMRLSRLISTPGSRFLDSLEIKTDEGGRFRVVVPRGSQVSLQMEESREGDYLIDQEWRRQQGYQAFSRQVVAEDMTDLELKIKLWAVQPLEGRLVDRSGRGIAQASVYMHQDVPAVKSDADGRFTLKTAPTDRDFSLFAITEDKKLAGLVSLEAGATSAVLRLEPTRDYKGEVTSPDGLPAPGLKFYMDLQLNASNIYRVRAEPKTDADGRFKARNLCPQAEYYAWWSSDNEDNREYDYGNASIELAGLKPGDPIRFEARHYINTLMGRVVDDQGKPIAGAIIQPQPSNLMPQDVRLSLREIKTDARGEFTIPRLAAGEIVLRVRADGYKTRGVKTPTDSVDLEVALAASTGSDYVYDLTVRDEDGRPVAGTRIAYYEVFFAGSGPTTRCLTATTDAAGKATFTRKPAKEGDEGRIFLGCDAPGYNLTFRGLAFDEDADAELVLGKGGCWSGQIVDEQNKPIPGANVLVNGMRPGGLQDSRSYAYFGEWVEREVRYEFRSDAQGRFQLDRFGSNNYLNAAISAPGYVPLRAFFEPTRDKGSKIFTLLLAVPLKGKVVRADGKPLPDEMGDVYAEPLPPGAPSSQSGTAKVNADGTFEFDNLQAGQYRIMARVSRKEDRRLLCANPPVVELKQGEPGRVTVTMELGTPVEGKVASVGSGTLNMKGKCVYARRDNENVFVARIAEDGTWKVFLPPGEFTLVHDFAQGGRLQAVEEGRKITVEKGKPLTDIVIEIKTK